MPKKKPGPMSIDYSSGWLTYSLALLRLQYSAAEVIARRGYMMSSGKMGVAEASRMVTEKFVAAATGATDGAIMASRGAAPAQIAGAVLAPIGAEADSNARRLRR